MSNKAAFVDSEKGQIVVRDAEIGQPGEGEVLVKVTSSISISPLHSLMIRQVLACAIQPADSKVAKLAMIPVEYPAILGSPVAGVIEKLGPGAKKFNVGERVVCGTMVFVKKKAKYGGLQRFAIVAESEIVEVSNSH